MTIHNLKITFSYQYNSFVKCFSAGKKWVHKQYTVGNENPLNATNRPTNQSTSRHPNNYAVSRIPYSYGILVLFLLESKRLCY